MQINDIFLESYSQARKTVKNLLGTTPEDYKVLLFVDPSLYQSVLLKTLKTGTPKAAISSTELDIFRDLKEKKFLPDAIDLFYPGRNPRIYFPSDRIDNQLTQEVMEAKLVQQLAKAVLCENTISRFPDVLNTLFRQDTIIYELFTNNVYEFVLERGASWVWQYFQDFTAVYRLLSLYNLDQFYVPPNTIRSASVFYNYLMEIKDITQKRSQTVLKAPLYDLILNGFAEIVLETHLQSYNDDELEKILTGLKANLGQPTGVIGKLFLEQRGDDLKSIYSEAINLKNDQELTSIWGRSETKEKMAEVRENLSNRALIWHASKSSYWSDLWPLRASQFDKIDSYVGKIQRRGYKS
ncbi:MAG: hypothetical protein OEY49_18175, partial [Candidatus Heimdallarchaeota archaeon]|nr:hypothetical protein [Candidatus Heimdallarchaeota archaeon]